MGYRIRVLGKIDSPIALDKLRDTVSPALIEIDSHITEEWGSIILKHPDGEPIAFIERNPIVKGELGGEEIEEFIDEVAECMPKSGTRWLQTYLPTLKVIYSFQILNGVYSNDGWTPLHRLYNHVWNKTGGILQADAEGFSNEDGHTIVWQFEDHVSGTWNMAVLDANNDWINFEMDLGNKLHRQSFMAGTVPQGLSFTRSEES